MNKIFTIVKREYLTRVKKRSFLVMTILGPILMAGLFVGSIYLAITQTEHQKIAIVDDSQFFENKFKNNKQVIFEYLGKKNLDEVKHNFYQTDYTAILYISDDILNCKSCLVYYYKKQPSLDTRKLIEKTIEKTLVEIRLKLENIDLSVIDIVNTSVNISTIHLPENGIEENKNMDLNTGVGFLAGLLIYMFIFMYGTQVLRGVIEEKVNRIVEVIISSVKPFQLMMGKIIGVAMVGLTQFLLWVVLTWLLTTVLQLTIIESQYDASFVTQMLDNPSLTENTDKSTFQLSNFYQYAQMINFPLMLSLFLFYFVGGYLLYSALFAAIGAMVDNEDDTQQFMLPITLPLIFSFIAGQFIAQNPEGNLSFWLSIIPFTSPVVMMIRIPFGVPIWQIILSASLLVIGFVFATWLASKVYRTGILMYGKKVTYKELWRWVRYKT